MLPHKYSHNCYQDFFKNRNRRQVKLNTILYATIFCDIMKLQNSTAHHYSTFHTNSRKIRNCHHAAATTDGFIKNWAKGYGCCGGDTVQRSEEFERSFHSSTKSRRQRCWSKSKKYDVTNSFTTRTASGGRPSSPTAEKISVATIHLISKGKKKRRHHKKRKWIKELSYANVFHWKNSTTRKCLTTQHIIYNNIYACKPAGISDGADCIGTISSSSNLII